MKNIRVFELSGKNAVSIQGGNKLHAHIRANVLDGDGVNLDFEGVEIFASPYFNASIGVFLKELTIDELLAKLKIENIEDNGRELLNHVIDNAIRFYSTQSAAIRKTFDDDVSE